MRRRDRRRHRRSEVFGLGRALVVTLIIIVLLLIVLRLLGYV